MATSIPRSDAWRRFAPSSQGYGRLPSPEPTRTGSTNHDLMPREPRPAATAAPRREAPIPLMPLTPSGAAATSHGVSDIHGDAPASRTTRQKEGEGTTSVAMAAIAGGIVGAGTTAAIEMVHGMRPGSEAALELTCEAIASVAASFLTLRSMPNLSSASRIDRIGYWLSLSVATMSSAAGGSGVRTTEGPTAEAVRVAAGVVSAVGVLAALWTSRLLDKTRQDNQRNATAGVAPHHTTADPASIV